MGKIAMTTLYAEAAREKTWDLIRQIKVAFLATFDPDGHVFHARPMLTLKQDVDTSTVWFFTRADSRKADEITRHPHALLTYADEGAQTFVSLTGTAFISDDRALIDSLWNEMAKIWYPAGKDDPEIRVIRFEVNEAEFWDSPSSVVTNSYSYLKAVVTGKPPADLGETGRVEFLHEHGPKMPDATNLAYEREAAASSEVLTSDIGRGSGGKPRDFSGDKLSISYTESVERREDRRRT